MTLDLEFVEALMRRQFPTVTRDRDGDLEAKLESPGGQVTMWVLRSGRTGSVLQCIAESRDHHVQRSRWAEAVWVCNQWNQRHFFPRVSLYIPDFAQCMLAPVQCRTIVELEYGEWDGEFLEAQLSNAGGYSVSFYQWLDADHDLKQLFGGVDEARDRQHIGRLTAAGKTPGATSFAEEFLVDCGHPHIREPEGFWW